MAKITDGSDLIFGIGCPGSKWSRVFSILAYHQDINDSDINKFEKYTRVVNFVGGKSRRVGSHSGAYFGPYNGIGENFDDLSKISKEEFILEIEKAFDDFDRGIKIIKSHWFSYNIPWLLENFPKAKIIFAYNGDLEAFKWWHLCGGWNIKFPIYTWYENDEKMYKQIKIENELILKFMQEKKLDFSITSIADLLFALELNGDLGFFEDLLNNTSNTNYMERTIVNSYDFGTLISVYNPNIENNELLDMTFANRFIKEQHEKLRVDELLINNNS